MLRKLLIAVALLASTAHAEFAIKDGDTVVFLGDSITAARTYGFGNLVLFTDWGWAGDRSDIRGIDQRWAVGAGASLLDGVVRIDLARGLRAPREWRVDMHLDAIM